MGRKFLSLIIILAAIAVIVQGLHSREKAQAAKSQPRVPASIIEGPGSEPPAEAAIKTVEQPAAEAVKEVSAQVQPETVAEEVEAVAATEAAAGEAMASVPKEAETAVKAATEAVASETSAAKETSTAKKTVEASPPLAIDFTLPTYDGKSLTLSNLKGKRGVVLIFFATWCPSCMAEVDQVKAFVEASKDKNVLVYGISNQPKDKVDKFIEDRKINYRILYDKEWKVGTLYGAQRIPLNVGIDAAGVVRYYSGNFPANTEMFIKVLTDPLAGDDMATAEK